MAIDITALPDFAKIEQGTSRVVADLFDVEYNFDQRLLQRKVRDHSTVIYNISILVPHASLTAWRIWFQTLENANFPPFTMKIETEGGYIDHQATFETKPRQPRQQIAGFWTYPCTVYAEEVETGFNNASQEDLELVYQLGDQARYLIDAVRAWPAESINGN